MEVDPCGFAAIIPIYVNYGLSLKSISTGTLLLLRCPAPTARNYWILTTELANYRYRRLGQNKTLSMGTILAYQGISSFLNTPKSSQGAFFAYPVGVIGSLFLFIQREKLFDTMLSFLMVEALN